MNFFIQTQAPENAGGQLQSVYDTLSSIFQTVPKVFEAQSIRPDLLGPLVDYINRLMIETHALPRSTKELIAAYVSKLNACAYCVDAHSAMAIAQGFTKNEVKTILEDIDGTDLIDDKTKKLLRLAETVTLHSYKIHDGRIQELRDDGLTDEELFEAIAAAALFNFMDRMADGLGAPVEGFQDMMAPDQS